MAARRNKNSASPAESEKKTDFPSDLFGHGEGEEARTAQYVNQLSELNAGYNLL